MDEIILFENTGSIEYFPDPDTIEEDPEEQLIEDPNEQLIEDPEEQLIEVPEEQLIEDSAENVEEEQKEIEEYKEKEGEENDIMQVPVVQNDIYTGDDTEHVSDYQIVAVSENNIITKPLNDYSVSESLQLYIFISLFVAGFIVLVRRAVLKWS